MVGYLVSVCIPLLICILFLQEMHIIAEDLRLCAVKNMEDTERRFCFEIVAPTK